MPYQPHLGFHLQASQIIAINSTLLLLSSSLHPIPSHFIRFHKHDFPSVHCKIFACPRHYPSSVFKETLVQEKARAFMLQKHWAISCLSSDMLLLLSSPLAFHLFGPDGRYIRSLQGRKPDGQLVVAPSTNELQSSGLHASRTRHHHLCAQTAKLRKHLSRRFILSLIVFLKD